MTTVPLASRLAAGLLTMLLALALVPVAASPADAARSRTTDEAKAEARLFGLHNRARTDPTSFGSTNDPADELGWNDDLAEAARDWSDQLASQRYLEHSDLEYAENIAYNWVSGSVEMTADEVMELWMASEGHHDNIMRSSTTEVGIGVTIDEHGFFWATVLFDDSGSGSATYPGSGEELAARPCDGEAHALVGDWDGSGSDGIGWWCDGRTRLLTASGDIHEFKYGRAGDVPVVADWNGNGRSSVSVIRDGTWHLNNSLRGGTAEDTFKYGRVTQGDVPIAGDWDYRGHDLPGIIRDREWHLRAKQAGGPADWEFRYGRLTAGDLPLWGDWDGDGRDTVGIVREGTWHLRKKHAGGQSDIEYTYGRVRSGDLPVVGDWNGDGQDTPAIVRGGDWHIKDHHSGGPADLVVSFPRP